MISAKTVAAGIVSVLLVVLLASLLLKAAFQAPADVPEAKSPGGALWGTRDFETILQGLLILGGVFAILMLLRSSRKEVRG